MWSPIIRHSVLRRKVYEKLSRRNHTDGPPLKLLRKYEHFQKDNGVPVFLKGGAMDKVLLGITVTGIAVGLSDGLWTLFKMARPKKK